LLLPRLSRRALLPEVRRGFVEGRWSFTAAPPSSTLSRRELLLLPRSDPLSRELVRRGADADDGAWSWSPSVGSLDRLLPRLPRWRSRGDGEDCDPDESRDDPREDPRCDPPRGCDDDDCRPCCSAFRTVNVMGRGVERSSAATSASSSFTVKRREFSPRMQSPTSRPNSAAWVVGAGAKSMKKRPLNTSLVKDMPMPPSWIRKLDTAIGAMVI